MAVLCRAVVLWWVSLVSTLPQVLNEALLLELRFRLTWVVLAELRWNYRVVRVTTIRNRGILFRN